MNEPSKRVNKMNVILSDIVKTTYCYHELYSGCVKGLEMPHTETCKKCMIDAFEDIVRSNSTE